MNCYNINDGKYLLFQYNLYQKNEIFQNPEIENEIFRFITSFHTFPSSNQG